MANINNISHNNLYPSLETPSTHVSGKKRKLPEEYTSQQTQKRFKTTTESANQNFEATNQQITQLFNQFRERIKNIKPWNTYSASIEGEKQLKELIEKKPGRFKLLTNPPFPNFDSEIRNGFRILSKDPSETCKKYIEFLLDCDEAKFSSFIALATEEILDLSMSNRVQSLLTIYNQTSWKRDLFPNTSVSRFLVDCFTSPDFNDKEKINILSRIHPVDVKAIATSSLHKIFEKSLELKLFHEATNNLPLQLIPATILDQFLDSLSADQAQNWLKESILISHPNAPREKHSVMRKETLNETHITRLSEKNRKYF